LRSRLDAGAPYWTSTENPNVHPLIRKLESIVDLSSEEREALELLPMIARDLRADQDIAREGDRPSQCCTIVEGFALRYKIMEGGKRQIFSFHIPGDTPDLQSLHLSVMDHSLATLTPCKLAFIPHDALRALIGAHPRIGDILWRDTLIDAAVFREWMVGMGRRSAYTRIAHLQCEVFMKLQVVGLAKDYSCLFPTTQAEIGDALGLSTVHVNRSLKQLRTERLIGSHKKGTLTILDWEGLQKAGEFDRAYLHIQKKSSLGLNRG
jgi:CRP-like cAMP-binding protein